MVFNLHPYNLGPHRETLCEADFFASLTEAAVTHAKVRRWRSTHQLDPGLKALGYNQLKGTSLSKLWFQMTTCTPS